MRKLHLAALLVFGAVIVVSTTVAAAPSLDVRNVPVGIVQPVPSWTGPQGDPHSRWGQWFKDKRTGIQQWRTHEFHDNIQGGGASTNAITGVATNVVYAGGPGTPIQSFDISATVFNDTPGTGSWLGGTNSHNETRAAEPYFSGYMYNVKLMASFAVDQTVSAPPQWVAPYRNRTPYIVAQDNDELAWYCWTPNNPTGMQPAGAYSVPTWDLPNIQQGEPPPGR